MIRGICRIKDGWWRDDVSGVTEERFRCYPLRGDSLAAYSRAYDKLLGRLLRKLYLPYTPGKLTIPPDEAVGLMSERIGIVPVRPSARQTPISRRSRRLARILIPLPSRKIFHRFLSEILDWDRPPFFKSFLRVDVDDQRLRIRCFAATGCAEHEENVPVEDEVVIRLAPEPVDPLVGISENSLAGGAS